MVPIPKNNKDPSSSKNYRVIAIASLLSKVLERTILSRYESVFLVVLCSLVLRKDIQQLFAREWCRIYSLNTCIYIEDQRFMVVFWMLAKHLTWLIMVFFSTFFILVVFQLQFFVSSSVGTVVNTCVIIGIFVCLIYFLFLMVFTKAVWCLLCIFEWFVEGADSDWCWLLLGDSFCWCRVLCRRYSPTSFMSICFTDDAVNM